MNEDKLEREKDVYGVTQQILEEIEKEEAGRIETSSSITDNLPT